MSGGIVNYQLVEDTVSGLRIRQSASNFFSTCVEGLKWGSERGAAFFFFFFSKRRPHFPAPPIGGNAYMVSLSLTRLARAFAAVCRLIELIAHYCTTSEDLGCQLIPPRAPHIIRLNRERKRKQNSGASAASVSPRQGLGEKQMIAHVHFSSRQRPARSRWMPWRPFGSSPGRYAAQDRPPFPPAHVPLLASESRSPFLSSFPLPHLL